VSGCGKALLGVPVRWTVGSGSGSLANGSTTTDAQGRTSNAWTLGSLVGTQTVTASLPGGVQVQFRATGLADITQSRLIRISGDGQTLITGTSSAALVVEVRDSANAAQAEVPILWSVESPDGRPSSLAGFQNNVTRTLTAAGGQARNTVVFTSPGSVVVRARFEGAPAATESVTFRLQAGLSPIPSLSPVARNVGEAFDEFCDEVIAATNPDAGTRDLGGICTVLNDNADDDPNGVGEALEQLDNEVAPTLGSSGIDTVNTQFDNLDLRLHMVRGEQFGGRQNQFNIGLWTPDGVLPLSFLPSVVVAGAEDGEQEVGADFGRWGFFATGQIGRGEADPGQRSPGFDFDISGLTAGVDYRFSDQMVAGVALGYSKNDAEVNGGGGKLDTTGWNVAGYLTWYNEKAWFVDATVLYGQLDYDLNRRIAFSLANRSGGVTTVDQVASASTDGDALGASFSVGRDWQKGPWNLTGYLKGNYSRVDTDAYTESLIAGRAGQGLGLAIEGRSTTSMTSIFGGRATYIMSRDWGILMPTATLEWEHEFEDDPNRVVARFAFDPTRTRLVREGDEVDSDYFNVGVGVSALFPGGRSAYVFYEELVGASRLSQGLLSLGVRLEF
jgi:outer membrane autotransporter protein